MDVDLRLVSERVVVDPAVLVVLRFDPPPQMTVVVRRRALPILRSGVAENAISGTLPSEYSVWARIHDL